MVVTTVDRSTEDEKTCEECGGLLVRPKTICRSVWKNRRFCNRQCSGLFYRKYPGFTATHGVCSYCGECFAFPLDMPLCARMWVKFCCKECYWNHRGRNPLSSLIQGKGDPKMHQPETATLSALESRELQECELRIDSGLRTCAQVGKDLEQIREARLYRAGYRTWNEYLRKRWNLSPTMASVYISTSRLKEYLCAEIPGVAHLPGEDTASMLMSLARQEPAAVSEVWSQALRDAEGASPSASLVDSIIASRPGSQPKAGRRTDEQVVEAYARGDFSRDRPAVQIQLSSIEARQLGIAAKQMGVRLHEAARTLLNKALRFEGYSWEPEVAEAELSEAAD